MVASSTGACEGNKLGKSEGNGEGTKVGVSALAEMEGIAVGLREGALLGTSVGTALVDQIEEGKDASDLFPIGKSVLTEMTFMSPNLARAWSR